jgi:hypothetical protein
MYRAGDLAALVTGTGYAVGIVLAEPAGPKDAAPPWIDRGMFLVGLADGAAGEGPTQWAPRPLLLPIEHEVEPELRAALTEMFAAYPR